MFRAFAIALAALGASVGGAQAIEISDGDIVVKQLSSGTRLGFEPVKFPDEVRGITIRIEGPEKYEAMVFSGNRLPEVELTKFGKVTDGEYHYEITGGTSERTLRKEKLNNGRGEDDPSVYRFGSFALGGKIFVRRGGILEFEQMVEKGSEETIPGKEVDDVDEGYEEPKDPGGEPKETNDTDKG
ncbi:MAG: hypothetical protein QNJ44_01870 [Rhodobacter sp.]|nr:hypothetical protein [Rhodobacter sp.]